MQKKASPEKILKRAQIQARDIFAQKILKGKNKADLSQSGKVDLEKKLDKKKAVIKSLAKRLIPKVKQAETARLAKQKEE